MPESACAKKNATLLMDSVKFEYVL